MTMVLRGNITRKDWRPRVGPTLRRSITLSRTITACTTWLAIFLSGTTTGIRQRWAPPAAFAAAVGAAAPAAAESASGAATGLTAPTAA